MTAETKLTELKGVGPQLAKQLAAVHLETVADLIVYYPRRYEDYSAVSTVKQLRPGPVTLEATISHAAGRYLRRGMYLTEAVATDKTGSVRLVWFNQPYRSASIKAHQAYFVSGQFELSRGQFAIMNPSIELVSAFPVNTARIVPVYRETKGLTSRQLRALVKQVLPVIEMLPETLPGWLVTEQRLLSRSEAIRQMHFPTSSAGLRRAQERLGFEEVFGLILASLLNKYEVQTERAPAVPFIESVAKNFVANLPFQLTDAQRRVIWQIYLDMQKEQPMNRLVEGDVGSGKTVVAAMAAVMVLHHAHQVALMAPTEILARQHAETLTRLLEPLGVANQVGLLVGGMKPEQKKRAHAAIADGKMRFIVGTHALIQDAVDMHELELIVIDEQHRFGVDQRKTLIAKAGHMPHVLNLTATPIPRSLALTLYGELDVSVLDAKPAGRQPVTTEIVAPTSRTQMYTKIKQELDAGRQMFVVAPHIEPRAKSQEPSEAVLAAEYIYDQMANRDFKNYRIGLLHGKMKPAEKNDVMERFMSHELDILVSTTVIEVGVDVPNASVMLIEGADRFGLAQIHQLRGRVGRGGHQGFCYLMMSDSRAPSARLRALGRVDDGFKLAELDLELRGPGAIYGVTQHGQLDLRIAKLTDIKLIARARQAAQRFIDRGENLATYSNLHERVRHLRAVSNLN